MFFDLLIVFFGQICYTAAGVIVMTAEPLIAAFSRDCEIRLLRAIRQRWYTSRWQKYLTEPRADHGLLLLLQGSMEYIWDGGSLSLRPGDLICLSKGSHYDVRMYTELGAVQTLLINFDFPQGEAMPALPPRLLCANAASRFATLFHNVVDALGQTDASPCLRKAHFYFLLSDLQSLLNRQSDPEGEIINQATGLLIREEVLSVREIARQCCISESSLRRLFRQRLNTSPAKYRSAARLQKACSLLVSTDLPVEEIAASLRYFDSAYFCKCFLEHFAMTPTQYRRKHRAVL